MNLKLSHFFSSLYKTILMLSKQEKLKYGEMLRLQMKEKEDAKRQDDLAKRGQYNKVNHMQKPIQREVYYQSPKINPQPYPLNQLNSKEMLQQKLEMGSYDPFGKAGGGAPNKINMQQNPTFMKHQSQPTHVQISPQDMYIYQQTQGNRNEYGQNVSEERQARQLYGGQHEGSSMKQEMNNSNQYGENLARNTLNYPMSKPTSDPYLQPQSQSIQHNLPYSAPQMAPMTYNQQQQLTYDHQLTHEQANEPVYQNDYTRVKTFENNDDLQDLYKKGGRNLLKLENQTVDQHLVKQKQKFQMQKYLKIQMEEAEQKKLQEKEKIRREQEDQERKNRQYLEMQKQKIIDQERKKVEAKQKITDQNVRNLQKRKELEQEAKDKIEREIFEREQKIKRQKEKQKEKQLERQSRISIEQLNQKSHKIKNQKIRKQSDSENSSVISSEISQDKGFNTQVSRQFFKKQRERQPETYKKDKKLQLFTNEIQKMRDEINQQGELFQNEIIKIKQETQSAQEEKRKADLQIQYLKSELIKKNQEDENKLIEALKRNDPYRREELANHEYYSPKIMKKTEKTRSYQAESYHQELEPVQPQPLKEPYRQVEKPFKEKEAREPVFKQYKYENPARQLDQSGFVTLDGDSKKIPVNLPTHQKLTLSKIGDFAQDTYSYSKPSIPKSNTKPIFKYEPQESIAEQNQSRYKQSQNHKYHGKNDELDRFVKSRESAKQNKWGEMSSLNEDVTKEIEDLLKKKDLKDRSSVNQMSNVARQILSRGGISYDGGNLNSINSGGTLDIEVVNNRNEARLKELRKLGVETINTNNDDDMLKLDQLLKRYN